MHLAPTDGEAAAVECENAVASRKHIGQRRFPGAMAVGDVDVGAAAGAEQASQVGQETIGERQQRSRIDVDRRTVHGPQHLVRYRGGTGNGQEFAPCSNDHLTLICVPVDGGRFLPDSRRAGCLPWHISPGRDIIRPGGAVGLLRDIRTTMRTKGFGGIARLPIRATLVYVAATLSVFAFGPFDWPVDNWPMLLGFMAAVMLALWLGYSFALAGPVVDVAADNWTRIIVFGALISAIVLFVAAPVYTGRMPWEVLSALRDQGAAYDGMQDQLELTAGSRGPVAFARILTWPVVFAVIPLGVLHWREMRTGLRMLVLMTLGSILVSSILRGTDRESADLMAMIGGAGGAPRPHHRA